MSDLLNMEYINSLPQPFIATQLGGWRWPVESIEVECGLVRIDVMGKLQVMDIMEFTSFMDADGVEHDVDSFFLEDSEPSDPAPYCSYGHRTKAQCDCGPIADNE